MNVGLANTIRPVNGAVEVRQQGGRDPSSFEQEELPPKEGHSAEGDAGSEKKIDARETLQLLSEGRISDMDGARFRIHLHRAAVDEKAASVRAEIERLTETVLASLREVLNAGLFDEETRALLEEVFVQSKIDAEELQTANGEEAFDAKRLYQDLQEAVEQYHTMLKRIFRLEETATKDGGEADEPGEVHELDERARSDSVEEVRVDDPKDEESETAAEQEEALVQRVMEVVEQAIEELQEMIDAEDALASSDDGGEEEKVYAKFATVYENLSDASSEVASFNTEG